MLHELHTPGRASPPLPPFYPRILAHNVLPVQLIATRALHELVYFRAVPAPMQPADGPSILARRSPQLTNGHGFGGSYEHEWAEGMPLGDIFTTVMRKAWNIQDARRRESMSPK